MYPVYAFPIVQSTFPKFSSYVQILAVPLHNLDLLRESYKEDVFIYYKWLLFISVFVGSVLYSIPFLFRLQRVFPPANSYRVTHCRNVRLGVLKGEEKGRRWWMREG